MRSYLCVALLLFCLPAFAQSHINEAQMRSSVQQLKDTLASVQKTLNHIDIGQLGVGYYEGKMFDQYREALSKSLVVDRLIADGVLRDNHLSATIDLQFMTNEVAHTVSDTATLIANAEPHSQSEKRLQSAWADELQEESTRINSIGGAILGYAMDRADEMEKLSH